MSDTPLFRNERTKKKYFACRICFFSTIIKIKSDARGGKCRRRKEKSKKINS